MKNINDILAMRSIFLCFINKKSTINEYGEGKKSYLGVCDSIVAPKFGTYGLILT